MSTYLLVDKFAQDWTEMWTPMSDHASASRCDKQQHFPDVTVVVTILPVLFDLILYILSTIFQLSRDGSSWVEPVLS